MSERLRQRFTGLRRAWRRHLLTLALLVTVVLAVQWWQTRHVTDGPLPAGVLDTPLPVFDATGTLRHSSLRAELAALQQNHPGQNVGLYVWAEWCPICKATQGAVDGVNAEHPVITVAMQSGSPAAVGRYLQSNRLAWHSVVDQQAQLSRALGFGAVPAFAVITPQGELRWPTVGLTSGWGMRLRLWLAR
ncbi:MAG: redoxin family protein [Hydrogenophaga sp.]